jgi:hypothetical protein
VPAVRVAKFGPTARATGSRALAEGGFRPGGEIAIWILAFVALEVQHPKRIVWEQWDCRRHLVKNDECGCRTRPILYL